MWTSDSATNPDSGGSSLVNAREAVLPVLEACEAQSVVEVGGGSGALTTELLAWGRPRDVEVTTVDPGPAAELVALAASEPQLTLIRRPSLDALATIELPDALILDGDHNYYTLRSELDLIAERSSGGRLPLLVLHDVGWPHARRDTYYAPDRIPPEHRQPLAEDAALDPAEPGIAAGGIPFRWAAAREGGPRNGVLTAIEDFLADAEGLTFARIPAFWGIGFIWASDAPYAQRVAETVAPWADNAMLERLEQHRIAHLVDLCRTIRELSDLEGVSAEQALVVGAQRQLLERMLVSSAFGVAELLSKVRQGGKPLFSRDQIAAALSIGEPSVRTTNGAASTAARANGQAPTGAS